MIDIKDAQQKLETWAADLERGMGVYIAPKALRKIAAALATPQPAQQSALSEVVGCFDAAIAEGLIDAIAATPDERLKDLLERRVMHAYFAATGASAQCTNSDAWNCKYCRKTETCGAICAYLDWGEMDRYLDALPDCNVGMMQKRHPDCVEPRGEPTPQAVPVAWLHPANAFCVTADPTAYARGTPLIPRQLLEQHQAAHAAEMSRLRKIEAEWAALSQDEGKARREIARLHDRIKELNFDVEYLTQQVPVAWGLFAKVSGGWVLQHPVRFTEHDANADRALYESGTQLDVRPLGVVAKPSAARFTEHDAVTVRYDLSPAQVEGAIEAKLISMGWTPPPPPNAAKTPGEPS